MVHIIGNSVGGNVNAEKLPCVGLRLNASKPESMLESGDMSAFPDVIMSKNRHALGHVQDHNIVTALSLATKC